METKNLLKSLKRRLGLITAILAMLAVSQVANSAETWGVVGIGGDWDNDKLLTNISGNYYAADISVSATTEFKIRKDKAWTTSYGGAQITASSNFNVSNSGGNNAKITISSSGTYKFIWNSSTKKLTVIYPSPQLNIKQSSSSWTSPSLTYSSTTKKYSGEVTISSIYNSGVVQVKNGENYVGNSGTAKMTRDNCSDWDFTTNSKQTGINFDVPGTYTFNFDPYEGKMSVTYPAITYTYKIGGLGNGWADGGTDMSVSGSTATCTVSLTAKTYTGNDDGFKIMKMGNDGTTTYRGNNGTMKRDNCSGWTMDSDAGNCSITADVAGNYTFSYDINTHKLTVTYPTITYTATATVGSVSGGTVTIDTETASSSSVSKTVASGTSVAFKATASSGYNFKGWGTSSSATSYESTANPYNVTITANKTLYAIFGSACTTPTAATLGTFNYPNATQVIVPHSGASAGEMYLLVRYEGSNPTITEPANGTTYAKEATLGSGVVVYSGGSAAETTVTLESGKIYTMVLYKYSASPCYYYSTKVTGTTTLPATATTADAENITTSSATLGGTLTNLRQGIAADGEYGIEWTQTVGGKTKGSKEKIGDNAAVGVKFSKNITSLTGATTYYYRSYVKTNYGGYYAYGEEKSFTTETPVTWKLKGANELCSSGWDGCDFTTGTEIITYTKNVTSTGEFAFKLFGSGDVSWKTCGCTITRSDCTNKDFSGNEGGDSKLVVDATGEYIFSFNTTNNTLSVTYPQCQAPAQLYLRGPIYEGNCWPDGEGSYHAFTKNGNSYSLVFNATITDCTDKKQFVIATGKSDGNRIQVDKFSGDGWTKHSDYNFLCNLDYASGTQLRADVTFNENDCSYTLDVRLNCTQPIVTANDPAAICGSGKPAMTASTTGGTIYWYSDSGCTQQVAQGPSYTPTTAITETTYYYVKAIDNGCASAVKKITAKVNQKPVLEVTGPAAICEHQSGTFTATPAGYGRYTWRTDVVGLAPQGVTTNVNNFTAGAVGNQSGKVYVKATNDGCEGDEAEIATSILSSAIDLGNITPGTGIDPAKICGQTVGLTFSVNNIAGITYQWTVPSGWNITDGAGTNAITVTASDNSGTVSVKATSTCNPTGVTKELTVTVYPVPSAMGITGGGQICSTSGAGDVTTATITTSNNTVVGNTYKLSKEGSSYTTLKAGNGGKLSFDVTAAGDYYLQVYPTVAEACISSKSSSVSVTTVTPPTSAPESITLPSGNICTSSDYAISCSAVDGATSYVWTAGVLVDAVSGTTTSATMTTGAVSGSAKISVAAKNNICASAGPAKEKEFTIQQTTSVTGMSLDKDAICSGSAETANATVSGLTQGAASYTWTSSNPSVATVSGDASSAVVTPVSKGTTTITYTLSGGCQAAPITKEATFAVNETGLTLSGSGAKSENTTYPWEYMTITATADAGSELTWNDLVAPAGVTYVYETGSADNVKQLKSAQTSNPNTDKFVVSATATKSGCSTTKTYDVYINAAPAEQCQ